MSFMKAAPVAEILKREDYWGEDLTALCRMWKDGMG